MHVEVNGFSTPGPRYTYSVLTKGPLLISSSVLFGYIFQLSHTCVEAVFHLGQMYVKDEMSV